MTYLIKKNSVSIINVNRKKLYRNQPTQNCSSQQTLLAKYQTSAQMVSKVLPTIIKKSPSFTIVKNNSPIMTFEGHQISRKRAHLVSLTNQCNSSPANCNQSGQAFAIESISPKNIQTKKQIQHFKRTRLPCKSQIPCNFRFTSQQTDPEMLTCNKINTVPTTKIKVGTLERMHFNIRACMVNSPVLIIHSDGVLISGHYSVHNLMRNMKNRPFMLRPNIINGIKLLSKSYIIILYSHGKVSHCQSLNVYLRQNLIFVDAIYRKRVNGDYDYSQIFKDLNLSEQYIKAKVLVIAPFEQATSNKDCMGAQISNLACSDGCADDTNQAISYSLPHTLYIPHLLSDDYNRSSSMINIAQIIFFLSLCNSEFIKSVCNLNANHLKMSYEKECFLLSYYDLNVAESYNTLGKFTVEFSDSFFTQKESSNIICIPHNLFNRVNWCYSFNSISEMRSTLLYKLNVHNSRPYIKERLNSILLRRWIDKLKKKPTSKLIEFNSSSIASIIAGSANLKIKLLSMVSANNFYCQQDLGIKHSHKAAEERKDARLLDRIEKTLKENRADLIEEICKCSEDNLGLVLMISKPLKDNIVIYEKDLILSRDTHGL